MAPDFPHDDSLESANDVVRCENGSCGKEVRRTATQTVPRKWGMRVFSEVWCLSCVRAVDKVTKKVLEPEDDDNDLGELGLDL